MAGNRHGPIDGRPLAFVAEATGPERWALDARTPELVDSWCRAVGPTAIIVWQYLARRIASGQFDFSIDELATYAGIQHGKVWHALDRLTLFQVCRWVAPDRLAVNVVTEAYVPRTKALR